MPDAKFAAMMSTQDHPWPSIPAPGLLTALDRKTASSGFAAMPFPSLRRLSAPSAPKGTAIPAVFQQGDFWFDYVTKCRRAGSFGRRMYGFDPVFREMSSSPPGTTGPLPWPRVGLERIVEALEQAEVKDAE